MVLCGGGLILWGGGCWWWFARREKGGREGAKEGRREGRGGGGNFLFLNVGPTSSKNYINWVPRLFWYFSLALWPI